MEKLTEKEVGELAHAYIEKHNTKEEIANTKVFYVVLWSESGKIRFNKNVCANYGIDAVMFLYVL